MSSGVVPRATIEVLHHFFLVARFRSLRPLPTTAQEKNKTATGWNIPRHNKNHAKTRPLLSDGFGLGSPVIRKQFDGTKCDIFIVPRVTFSFILVFFLCVSRPRDFYRLAIWFLLKLVIGATGIYTNISSSKQPHKNNGSPLR